MNIAPKKIILSLLATALCFSVYAQQNPPPPPDPGPPGLPINDNILILLLVGLIYGVYILKRFKFQTK